jgi:monoterpene epsilon-lactone hydrolase
MAEQRGQRMVGRRWVLAMGICLATGRLAGGQELPRGPGEVPPQVSPEGRAYVERLRGNIPFGTDEFSLDGLRAVMGRRRRPTIEGVRVTPVEVAGVAGEWVVAPGAESDVRVLYIHGGGFVSGSGGFYLPLAAHLSQRAKCAVLLVDYRLAPEHPFPAALDDCVAAHEWLRNHGPDGPAVARATFVAGDSAGGNLTLATVLALRDRHKPLPLGAIPISPVTDFALESESLQTVHDPIIDAKTLPVFREHYLGMHPPRDPLASPVYARFDGMPPVLIQAGEHEMLRDDAVRVATRIRETGGTATLEVWKGMFHVFQSHDPLLPEAREAFDHMAHFIRGLVPPR